MGEQRGVETRWETPTLLSVEGGSGPQTVRDVRSVALGLFGPPPSRRGLDTGARGGCGSSRAVCCSWPGASRP